VISNATIIGNLVRKPESREVEARGEKQTVTEFSVAVNHGTGDDAPVSFFDCVAWNGLGLNLAKYKDKGDQIAVVGDLKQDRWEKDGAKHSRVRITARTIQFLGKRGPAVDAVPDEALVETAPPAPAAPVQTAVEVETPAVQTEAAGSVEAAASPSTQDIPF
jgi:single stranded DNA-binding protein